MIRTMQKHLIGAIAAFYCSFTEEFHGTRRDNMTAVVLLIVVMWMLMWIRAVNDHSRNFTVPGHFAKSH